MKERNVGRNRRKRGKYIEGPKRGNGTGRGKDREERGVEGGGKVGK
jgi:hypothetical protein